MHDLVSGHSNWFSNITSKRGCVCCWVVCRFVPGYYVKYNNNWNWNDDKRNTPQVQLPDLRHCIQTSLCWCKVVKRFTRIQVIVNAVSIGSEILGKTRNKWRNQTQANLLQANQTQANFLHYRLFHILLGNLQATNFSSVTFRFQLPFLVVYICGLTPVKIFFRLRLQKISPA